METIYARLVKLLGQPPNGIMFNQLVAELSCEPLIDPPMYTLSALGVTLFANDDQFSVLLIHIDTPSTRQGWVSRYEWDLPNAIDEADGSEVIEQKLGVRPMSSESLSSIGLSPKHSRNSYVLPPFVVLFEFAIDTKKLSSITISIPSALPSSVDYGVL